MNVNLKISALALALSAFAMETRAQVAPVTAEQSPEAVRPSPLATEIAAKLFPDGTYRRMLGPQFQQMMSAFTDTAMTTPLGPMLKAAGLPDADVERLDKVTATQVMAIVDPSFKERMNKMMESMFGAMIPIFEKLEPDLRAGLAVSLQNRFSSAQLEDLRLFFATPTGAQYAADQWMLFMDPAVMGRMQQAMPKIMEQLPTIIKSIGSANEAIPKPRTYKELSAAERSQLCDLLGMKAAAAKCK